MHDLHVVGHGMIRDPDNQNMELITFRAPVQTGNIMITPGEVLRDHETFPKFFIDEVNLVLDLNNIVVSA